MLRLLETINRCVDCACGINCHCRCLWLFSVDPIHSGFVMIVRVTGFGMGVGRFTRRLRGVGVLAMPDAGLDKMRRVESTCKVPRGAGVQWLLVPTMGIGQVIDRRSAADGVEVTDWVISGTWELFSQHEGVVFWPWIANGMEHLPWAGFLLQAGTETPLLAGANWAFPDSWHFCWFWRLARLRIFPMTRLVSGSGLWEDNARYRCSTLRRDEEFPVHAYAMAGEVDSYLSNHGGIRQKREASGYTALDSKPWQYSGMRSLENYSIMLLTAIKLNSD
jgi:hypothetical protein